MQKPPSLNFDQPDVFDRLEALDDSGLDTLDFGVIGFDADNTVRRYNAFESRLSGVAPHRVLGNALFAAVAPCMNNFIVAQRFEDCAASGESLDATVDYVFTLRMLPAKVVLRMLVSAKPGLRYLLVNRRP